MIREQAELLGCPPPDSCPRVAKLSVFGVGMKSHTGVASRLFTALASERINVDLISTTEVRVNVIVDGAHGAACPRGVACGSSRMRWGKGRDGEHGAGRREHPIAAMQTCCLAVYSFPSCSFLLFPVRDIRAILYWFLVGHFFEHCAKSGTFGTRLKLKVTCLATFGTRSLLFRTPNSAAKPGGWHEMAHFGTLFDTWQPTVIGKLEQSTRKGAKHAKELTEK